MAEGPADRHPGGVIIAVAHIEALPVFSGAGLSGEVGAAGHIQQRQRPAFIEFAIGVQLAQQRVRHGSGARLAAQVAVQDGAGLAGGGQHKGRAAGEHQHHVFVGGADRLDERLLSGAEFQFVPVHALGFSNLIKTHTEQHHFRSAGQFHRLLNFGGIGGRLGAGEARFKPGDVQPCVGQRVQQAVQPGGVHHAGACALIPGRFGKVPDDGGLFGRVQRQDAVIFQQHQRAFGAAAGHRMMGLGVKGFGGGVHRLVEREHHWQQFPQTVIQRGFLQPAFPHRLYQLHGAVRAGGGHHQRRAVFHALGMEVVSAPVGDHKAVKAPVLPQNFLQQVAVFVGVAAVDLVVGGHDGLGMAFLDGNFKTGEVQFPQRALIHHGIHAHTA